MRYIIKSINFRDGFCFDIGSICTKYACTNVCSSNCGMVCNTNCDSFNN
ncbi:Clo7bot family Cys-rich peptide [Paraclostridium bifermentans]|nr:Clo7bot family Cys-rich peptide [Paraclostridium bifermentans]TQO55951.1 Clo7bot family Cys-rich peptide [Paraclostridium bifermentans]GKZ02766.1 hypothetical protein ANS014_12000 [Paraclostridium bifermentans]GKZ06554.1 hypothetical protein ANS015_14370 [Paraclostridium bifermentans]GKZ10207.1 hypothetical protein ANS017_15910 [Paraclostridium bifermentans]